MIKKIMPICLAMLATICANAQMTMGSWKIYTPFNGVDFIADTPSKVYYTSVGYLFSYDPESQETYAYTVQNKLSGSDITKIAYNPERKYLFVAYSDGNIDLLFDSGEVVNMSDIRDANLTSSKTVNDVFFDDGKIYAATDFGVVIFDDTRYVVLESGIYSRKIDSFVKVGGHYLIAAEKQLYSLESSSRINSFSKYKPVSGGGMANEILQIVPLQDNKLVYVTEWQRGILQFEPGTNTVSALEYFPDGRCSGRFVRCKDGWFYNYGSALLTISDSGADKSIADLPAGLRNSVLAIWDSTGSIWSGTAEGISEYSFDGSVATMISGPAAPGSISVPEVDDIKIAADGTVYFMMTTNSRHKPSALLSIFTPINRLRNGEVLNIRPDNIVFDSDNQDPAGDFPKNNMRLAIDPDNSDRIYVGNWREGFMVFENDSYVTTYNGTNSPVIDKHNGGSANAVTHEVAFDSKGNLWGLQGYKQDHHLMVVLPADKRKSGTDPQVSDWTEVRIPKSVSNIDMDGRIFHASKSGMMMVTSSAWTNPVIFYDYAGTVATSDDKYVAYEKFTDQDGREFKANYNICFAEDHNGKVWLGTSDGVIEFPSPKSLLESNAMRRPKVNRNDGTNTADFLLGGSTVLSIAVDHANRKWLATKDNGVYLVNPEGTEILQHFTTENSPLPSDHVGAVAVSPTDNKVYFGTLKGLAEYSSTSSPAADSFSEVIAYPNPVRPGFSGWITIKGLMANSYVKITDAAGNLVFATVSDGGMVTWNGCNTVGHPVPTGVYYIFASQKDGGSSSAVSKIMIVR